MALQASRDMKRANTAALRQGSVSVVRAPLLGCLTVPRGGGLVVGAFKLPGGARRTEESKGLLRRKVGVGGCFGCRGWFWRYVCV